MELLVSLKIQFDPSGLNLSKLTSPHLFCLREVVAQKAYRYKGFPLPISAEEKVLYVCVCQRLIQ
jgi:hypothetical protein